MIFPEFEFYCSGDAGPIYTGITPNERDDERKDNPYDAQSPVDRKSSSRMNRNLHNLDHAKCSR